MTKKFKTAEEVFGKGWNTPSGMAHIDALLAHADARDFHRTLKHYEKDPKNFWNAWYFLAQHPANDDPIHQAHIGRWEDNYNIMVVKVNPKSMRVSNDNKKNTLVQFWIEWGPWLSKYEACAWSPGLTPADFPHGIGSHDPRTDTGGATFEEAIINLAHNVYMLYGAKRNVEDEAKLKKKDRW